MCRLRVKSVEEGLISSESVVQLSTIEGDEEIVVAADQVQDNSIRAAFIGRDNGHVLVELPRESAAGRRRVWVDERVVVGA